MKKTQEILGLPIISISDGMEVGKVKSLIINADKGAIDYVVVDSGIQILSARVIPTDSVLGVGEYALTIENDNSINDISKIPAAIDLLQKNIQVKGTKVLTKKGRLIGEIGDIYVDEDDNCKITGLEYIADITQKRIRIIPRDSVITFGKNLVVVTEDVESSLLDTASQIGSGEKSSGSEKKNLVSFEPDLQVPPAEAFDQPSVLQSEAVAGISQLDEIIASEGNEIYKAIDNSPDEAPQMMEEFLPQEFTASDEDVLEVSDEALELDLTQEAIDLNTIEADGDIETVSEEAPLSGEIFPEAAPVQAAEGSAPVSDTESNAANLFEQRQRQYLNGRRATKTIMDNMGEIIVDEGSLITDQVIDVAKDKGKLIELVMNNKA